MFHIRIKVTRRPKTKLYRKLPCVTEGLLATFLQTQQFASYRRHFYDRRRRAKHTVKQVWQTQPRLLLVSRPTTELEGDADPSCMRFVSFQNHSLPG